jgi:hypothetical protein
MSTSPAAAQAAADNQQFWAGIGKLSEQAQRSFWDAAASLSGYIGESASPRTLSYDTSSPPPGMPWYERIFFYIGQSAVNQGVAAQAQSKAIAEGAGWLWGALQGDFNKSPTTGQVITGGIISMIPIVDQVCDVRDVIANCIDLSDAEARKDNAKWLALGLTCIGFVPEFGSAVKTVAKVGLKEGARLLDVLKHMEWIERNFQKLKVACPWGYAPIEWLRKYDWIGQFNKAGAAARKAFENATAKAQAAAKYAIGAIKTKLLQLVDLFKAIAAKIVDTMAELGRKLKAKIDEMLGGARKEAGNYGAAPGGPNKHGQKDKPPPKRATTPPHTVERNLSSEEANAAHVKAGRNPPYANGKSAQDIRLTDDATFARVHGADNKARSWMMRKEDIDGLTPAQIKDKFALPETPSLVSDVNVPAGTLIRTGEVAPQTGWGSGGATQFELLQRLPENLFTNTRPLGGGL